MTPLVSNLQTWGEVLSGSAALVCLGIAGLLAYEVWAIATAHQPLSFLVRRWVGDRPGWALIATLVLGVLLGHFFWH